MPRLSRWSVRLAFLYLVLGFTLGALILTHKAVRWPAWAWKAFPSHQEVLLFGWTAQFALGIAYWILPRFRGGRRGRTWLAAAAIGFLNLGIWLVVLRLWLGRGAEVFGRGLEALAVLFFLLHAWPRIKPAGA